MLHVNVVVCYAVQMVSAVCQFPTVQSAVEATVAVLQSSIPVARIGLYSLSTFHLDTTLMLLLH